MKKIDVVAVTIHSIRRHSIAIYLRDATGKHGNEYVKVLRRGERGKFLLKTLTWDGEPDLERSAKNEIEEWVTQNLDDIRRRIREL